MSDWGTMVATIRTRCRKTAADEPDIKRGIIDAIGQHRHECFNFNQARFDLTLTTDFGSYAPTASTGVAAGLPSDVVKIMGKTLTLRYNGVATDEHDVTWVSRETMDAARRDLWPNGEPEIWTFWNERLELHPKSNSSTHVLYQVPYIQDVGTLIYKYSGGAFTFYEPDGSTALTDAYTSPWFNQKQGYHMISFYAEYLLWSGIWSATAGQDGRALQNYASARASVAELSASQSAPHHNEPYIPEH